MFHIVVVMVAAFGVSFVVFIPSGQAVSGNWSVQGPFGLTTETTQFSRTSNRLPPVSTNEVLVISPTSSSTVYVATKGGGIFKTTNGGDTWQSINTGLTACEGSGVVGWVNSNRENLVQAIAIDPNNASVLWAGVTCRISISDITNNLYKSVDSGATWTLKRSETGTPFYYSIRVSPSDSNTVYFVRPQKRIDRTTDGGSTFATVSSTGLPQDVSSTDIPNVRDLIVHPTVSSTLFALVDANDSDKSLNSTSTTGIFKSTDGGDNWSPINGNLTKAKILYPRALKMAGTDSNTLYFVSDSPSVSGGDELEYLLRTVNGGTNWTTVATSTRSPNPYFVYSFSVDVNTTTTLYTTDGSGWSVNYTFRKSTNSGATWSKVGDIGTSTVVGEDLAFPIVQATSDANTFYLMARNNIYRSTDGGATWTRKDSGLSNLTASYLTALPTASSTLFVITSDPARLYKTTDSGATWQELAVSSLRGLTADKVFATSSNVYLKCTSCGTLGTGVLRSTDGGTSWTVATSTSAVALEYSPINDTLYAIFTVDKLQKSTDGGTTWTVVGTLPGTLFTNILVSQANTNYIYLWYKGGTNQLLRSTDGGASWSGTLTAGNTISDLAVSSASSTVLYAAVGATGLQKSTNGGTSWTTLGGWPTSTPNIVSVNVDPLNSNAIYASSYGQGVFVSTNAGGIWNTLNTNLGNLFINKLAVNPQDTSIIWGATGGSSVWQDPAQYDTIPSVSSVSPSAPLIGSTITINGSGFGASQGNGKLYIGGVVTPTSWSDTQVTANLSLNILPGSTSTMVSNNNLDGSLPYEFSITVRGSKLPAADVLGQFDGGGDPDFTLTNWPWPPEPDNKSFNEAKGARTDSVNKRLFIADGLQNRVLAYSLDVDNVLADRNADYVLGQANFSSWSSGTTSSTLNYPFDIAVDSSGNRIFVVDNGNNRVLVFDLSAGITNGMSASYVLGQANFTSSGSATTATGMNSPESAWYDVANQRLFVSDGGNNRVLVFDLSAGITNGMSASYVLGQANFTSSGSATTATGMNWPIGITYDSSGQNLFVSDRTNRRVLIFDLSAGITSGMSATYALGQPNLATSTNWGVTAASLLPYGLALDPISRTLFVGDGTGARVLGFSLENLTTNISASSTFPAANYATAGSGTTSSSTISSLFRIAYNTSSSQLFVSDDSDNRVLVFNLPRISTASLTNATFGTAYSATLSTTGGTSPYECSLSSGALPSGVTISSSTCELSGTPASASSYSFTVALKDSSSPLGIVTRKAFTLEVATAAQAPTVSIGGHSVDAPSSQTKTEAESSSLPSVTTPPISTPGKTAVVFAKGLYEGVSNHDVTALQEFLSKTPEIYPEGLTTGYFGPLTKKAVQRFQEKYGIAKTGDPGFGYVGPKTRKVLNELINQTTADTAETGAGQKKAVPAPPVVPGINIEAIKDQIRIITEKINQIREQLRQLNAEDI
ncbi:MAG: YCF48-related protein [Candidatus Jorgensenbacteria bacterium]|nr:YCF48-related protein [Candidatus Jorgensenbacteria bacterium]